MKMTARYWLAAAVGLILAETASAGLISDNFEAYTNLTPLINGTNQWYASDATVVVQTNKVNAGQRAAVVTEYQSLTNIVNAADSKIWSDFFTLPRRYSADTSTGPAADPNATAQIYLTSNGEWAVISRPSLVGAVQTNIIASPIVPDDTNTWQHVSVLHDYSDKKWSLFVQGTQVAANLYFIDTNAASNVWFNMQNRGGGSAWLDDVTITNRVPLTLTADDDGDGLLDAWEVMYFGATNVTNSTSGDYDLDGITDGVESRIRADPTTANDPNFPFAADLPFYDGFENMTEGGLYGKNGWNAALTSRVNVVSSPVFLGAKSVKIVAGTASHEFYPSATYTSVWTHLVLKPVPMSEEQSRLARTDTVAFYVDTNYMVNALNSNQWMKLTNVLSSSVGGTNVGTFAVDPTKWVRFVTKSDYKSRTWSLYAENVDTDTSNVYARLLASDLNFSTSGIAYTNYQSLVIENMLDPNTTSYVDQVEITLNTSPWVDTDGDGVPDAYEESSPGMDPLVNNSDVNSNGLPDSAEYAWGGTNSGRILGLGLTNNTQILVDLAVNPSRTYQVVGSPDPDATFTNVGTFYTGASGETDEFVDPTGLARGGRFFYRLIATSPEGTIITTNDETYVWYKQRSYAAQRDHAVGVPVNYGTNNTLDGRLGADLARGLAGGASEGTADALHMMNAGGTNVIRFWLKNETPPRWMDFGTTTYSTQALPPGAAVILRRRTASPDTTNAVLAGLMQTNSVSIDIQAGWNLFGWPYDSTNTWAWGLTNANVATNKVNRDQIYLIRNGLYMDIRPTAPGTWKVYGRPGAATPLESEPFIQPGESFYYYRAGSADLWAPVNP